MCSVDHDREYYHGGEQSHGRAAGGRVPEPPCVDSYHEQICIVIELLSKAWLFKVGRHVEIYPVGKRYRHPQAKHILLPRVADIIARHVHYERERPVEAVEQQFGEYRVRCGVDAGAEEAQPEIRTVLEKVIAEHVRAYEAREEEPFLIVRGP